jgi:hypothetical protein
MIRFILGFFIVFGSVGGIDNGEDLMLCSILAIVGIALMFFGSRKFV